MIAEKRSHGKKPSEKSEKASGASFLKEALGWLEAIVIALVASLLIRSFLFVTTEVNMSSMQDTLQDGQRLIIYKLGYFFSPPERGDIIVFRYQEGTRNGLLKYLPLPDPHEIDYIKRVIALPGETVDMRDGYVYVNGEVLEEHYAKGITTAKGMTLPDTVPENKIMVLGDNREISRDSREIGYISMDRIIGKAVFRILPLKDFGGVYDNLKQDR